MVKTQNYKGGTRVSILCGKRALSYISLEHGIIDELVRIFTTSQDNIISSVDKLQSDLQDCKGQMVNLQNRLLDFELKEIDEDLENVFLVKEPSTDQNVLRKTVNLLAASHTGFCGVFAGDEKNGYRYIIASGTKGKDCKMLQKVLSEEFGARGGGNSPMIQGSIESADIKALINRCQEF